MKALSPSGVVILGCLCVEQIISSNMRESESCFFPGGVRTRAVEAEGSREPILHHLPL